MKRALGFRRTVAERDAIAEARRGELGYSLVEVVIAMAISAIVIVGMYESFNNIQKWWMTVSSKTDMSQNARAGLETFTRDMEMAGYHPTQYGDTSGKKTGLSVTWAAPNWIEIDQQRPDPATIGSATPAYTPAIVYYHLATDVRTGKQNLYRQIRSEPNRPADVDELVAENIAEFSIKYYDKDEAEIDVGSATPYTQYTGAATTTADVDKLKKIRHIQAKLTVMPGDATSLTSDIAAGATTIEVVNTARFPSSGQAFFSERNVPFSYSGKDATHFTGCTGIGAAFAKGTVVAHKAAIGTAAKPIVLTVDVRPQNLTSGESVLDATPPPPPAGSSIRVIDTGSCSDKLKVQWVPPSLTTYPDLAGFEIYYGPTEKLTIPLSSVRTQATFPTTVSVLLNAADIAITKSTDRDTQGSSTVYSIQMTSYDSSGNYSALSTPAISGWSATADCRSFTGACTPANDTVVNPAKPTKPASITVAPAAGSSGELTITWASEITATAGYRLYRSTVPFVSGTHINPTPLAIVPKVVTLLGDETSLTKDTVTFTDTGSDLPTHSLLGCTTYYYAIASVNCDETLVNSYLYSTTTTSDYTVGSGQPLDTTQPPSPTLVGQAGWQRAFLRFDNPTAEDVPDFDRTEIYWTKGANAAPALNTTTCVVTTNPANQKIPDTDNTLAGVFKNRGTATPIFDSETLANPTIPTLDNMGTYKLLAVSYDKCGNCSDPSAQSLSLIALCGDDPAGPPPGDFDTPAYTSCQTDTVTLGWNYPRSHLPVTDAGFVKDIAGFHVYRYGPTNFTTPVELTSAPTWIENWTDSGALQAGGAYKYVVRAADCVYENDRANFPTNISLPFTVGSSATLGNIYPGAIQRYLNASFSATTLTTAAVSTGATTIAVTSTAAFGTSGQISIGCHLVSYTGKTATSFTGCSWPSSSTGYSALINSQVTQYNAAGFAALESYVTTLSDASTPYTYHNNVKLFLQNTSLGTMTIRNMAVEWENSSVQLKSVTIGGTAQTPAQTIAISSMNRVVQEDVVTGVTKSTNSTSTVSRGDSTVNVVSTTGFTTAGEILVDGIRVAYTSLTPTSFVGCSWLGLGNPEPSGAVNSGEVFAVNVQIRDLATGIGAPSIGIPLVLHFTTPDGLVNRLTDMRGDTITISHWTDNDSLQASACLPDEFTFEVPRGPVLGGFSQDAPDNGIKSHAVIGVSGTARDNDIVVPGGFPVNVLGTVIDNSGDVTPDGCPLGFASGNPRVVGVAAAPADIGVTPMMPAVTFPVGSPAFERTLYPTSGVEYAIYRTTPSIAGEKMPLGSDTVNWYFGLAVDATGNWDRFPNPDIGSFAYLQPPAPNCVAPVAPKLSIVATAKTRPTLDQAVLSWTRPATYTSGAVVAAGDQIFYDLYTNLSGNPPFSLLASNLTALSYTQTADLVSDSNYYVVVAKNACTPPSTSANSNVVRECLGTTSDYCSLLHLASSTPYYVPTTVTLDPVCMFQGNGGTADTLTFRFKKAATTSASDILANIVVTETAVDSGEFEQSVTFKDSGTAGAGEVLSATSPVYLDLVFSSGVTTGCTNRSINLTGGACGTVPNDPDPINAGPPTPYAGQAATVTWSAPFNTPDLAGYILEEQYRTCTNVRGGNCSQYTNWSNWTNVALATPLSTSVTRTGLVVGSRNIAQYRWHVRAKDSCSTPNYSGWNTTGRIRITK